MGAASPRWVTCWGTCWGWCLVDACPSMESGAGLGLPSLAALPEGRGRRANRRALPNHRPAHTSSFSHEETGGPVAVAPPQSSPAPQLGGGGVSIPASASHLSERERRRNYGTLPRITSGSPLALGGVTLPDSPTSLSSHQGTTATLVSLLSPPSVVAVSTQPSSREGTASRETARWWSTAGYRRCLWAASRGPSISSGRSR